MNKFWNVVKITMITLAAALVLTVLPTSATEVRAAGVMGIDVSEWQGDIDWNAVKASGVNYAMIRVGNTKYGVDNKFVQNVIGANAAGIRVGAYVYTYATNAAEAAQDAAFAIALMQNTAISFPVAIDIEDSVHKTLTPAQQQEIVNTFCSMVYAAGYQPMVYASRNWFLERLGNTAWDQWVAQYDDVCDYPYGYTMWQATSSGSVAGIAGNVDIDYCFKDYFTTIQQNGFAVIDGKTYYFVNWRKQFGIQTIDGLQFAFDGTGALITDQTVTDASGNIIRYCKDGHIVTITAEMQAAAAQTQAAYDQAKALYEQYVATAEAAEAAFLAAPTDDAAAALAIYQQQVTAQAELVAQAEATNVAAQAAIVIPD